MGRGVVAVVAVEPVEHHAPPALGRCGLARPALDLRAVIHHLQIHVEPDPLQQVGPHLGDGEQARIIAGRQHHHLLAGVAGAAQQALCGCEVARHRLHPGIRAHRLAQAPHPHPVAPYITVLAGDGGHEIGLPDCRQNCAAHRGVVERRMQRVEAQDRLAADEILDLHRQRGIAPQGGCVVRPDIAHPVHLALLQAGDGGGGIGDDAPFHPLEMRHLAAGHVVARFRSRHVAGEALVHHARAHHALIGAVAERPAAHHLGHPAALATGHQALGQDEGRIGCGLGQRIWQQREWPLQPEFHHAVAIGAQLIELRGDLAREHIHAQPALQARHRIACQYRRAIMEAQPLAQRDPPAPAIVFHCGPGRHLRLRLAVAVQPVERVVHHVRMLNRHVRSREERVQHGHIRHGHEAQRGALCPRQVGRRQGQA